jgi:hypothetical protein
MDLTLARTKVNRQDRLPLEESKIRRWEPIKNGGKSVHCIALRRSNSGIAITQGGGDPGL